MSDNHSVVLFCLKSVPWTGNELAGDNVENCQTFFYISPTSGSTIVADVSSQFSTSQLCNMIVFAARLMAILFRRQIVLSMHKKLVKKNSLGAKVDYF